jgi:hypothetical protein
MKKITLLLTLILILTFHGCNRENLSLNPYKAIIGKWEIIETTFGPVTNPSEYEEYFPDSILLIYNYDEERFYESKYWLNDSLLYIQHTYTDPVTNDTILVSTLPYRYKFLTTNKLQLEFQHPSMNPLSIYKRIK